MRAREGPAHAPVHVEDRNARNRIERGLRIRAPQIRDLCEAGLAFAGDNGIGTGTQINLLRVRRVRSVDDGAAAVPFGGGDHRKRVLATLHGAHLGNEVEIVFHDRDERRTVAIERSLERINAVREGGIEMGDVVTVLAQQRGCDER